ncbi:MAG: hypothetical protein ACRC9E_01720 [Plesiomonas shigelloides]
MSEITADKKWYSAEDIEVAKMALSDLPDLTPSRLTKNNVLEQIKDQIIELSTKKREGCIQLVEHIFFDKSANDFLMKFNRAGEADGSAS